MDNTPIEPKEFTHGTKVVQIDDLRIARGLSRRSPASCPHRSMDYDSKERRVWCEDCETEVHPFDAFRILCDYWSLATASLEQREEAVAEAENFSLRSRAAKKMDEMWRKRSMTPLCPHCNEGLLPQDVISGLPMASKALIEGRRNRNPKS